MNLQTLQTEWRDYSGGELDGSPAWDDLQTTLAVENEREPVNEPASTDD